MTGYSNYQRQVSVPTEGARYTRRLTDKILIAFHHACDQGELDIAASLLHICENAMQRPAPPGRDHRRASETLVACYERLWFLRHPEANTRDQDNFIAA